jgi:putative tricarboxylic transport membrane protein
MLVSQGDLSIMFSNGLVGSITTLALILLVWPLISKALALVKKPKEDEFAAERPVD